MSRQSQFKKYQVLGVEIDALSISEATDYITKMAAEPASPARYVVKAYVEFMDPRGEQVKNLLNQAELCLSDGISLNWAVYYLYGGRHSFLRLVATLIQIALQPKAVRQYLPERIGGINFTWPLLKACQEHQLKLFVIASPKQQSLDQTITHLQAKFLDLEIVGSFKGHLEKSDETQLTEQLQATQPDIILVGSRFPIQEELMARLTKMLDHGILIGEGGTFDYQDLGGGKTRAPKWLQGIGLEWLWRLILEPSRLRRQLAIPRFIWKIYRSSRHP